MSHLIYIAIGFPPAAKSSAYRMRAVANLFCEAGWDVTVVTIHDEGWEREFGIDPTLSEGVDPRIRIIRLPLSREDLEPDIRTYSEFRARHPKAWLTDLRRREMESFPEPVFGLWREALERSVAAVHDERPADLVLVSPAPNTGMAAAWKLWSDRGVPYAVDHRDAWSLHTYRGVESFTRDSPAGQWEGRIFENARELWCVNAAIADFYRSRFPAIADRIRVVENGHDPFLQPVSPTSAGRRAGPELRFSRHVQLPRRHAESGAGWLARGQVRRSCPRAVPAGLPRALRSRYGSGRDPARGSDRGPGAGPRELRRSSKQGRPRHGLLGSGMRSCC